MRRAAALAQASRAYGPAWGWWIILLGTIGVFLALNPLLTQIAESALAPPAPQPQFFDGGALVYVAPSPWRTAAAVAFSLAFEPVCLGLMVMAAYAVFMRASPRRLIAPLRGFRWRRAAVAAGLLAAWMAAVWGAFHLSGALRFEANPTANALIFAAALLPAVALQTAAEEIAFRGAALRAAVLTVSDPHAAAALTALPFAALHLLRPDISSDPAALALLAALGYFWAVATLRDGGLEIAFGLHFMMNYTALGLLSGPLHGARLLSYSAPPPGGAIWVALGILAIVFWMTRTPRPGARAYQAHTGETHAD